MTASILRELSVSIRKFGLDNQCQRSPLQLSSRSSIPQRIKKTRIGENMHVKHEDMNNMILAIHTEVLQPHPLITNVTQTAILQRSLLPVCFPLVRTPGYVAGCWTSNAWFFPKFQHIAMEDCAVVPPRSKPGEEEPGAHTPDLIEDGLRHSNVAWYVARPTASRNGHPNNPAAPGKKLVHRTARTWQSFLKSALTSRTVCTVQTQWWE